MESTAFFEKKISLTPRDFNRVKISSIEDILMEKANETMVKKCSEHGFVLPGSLKLLSRSMGYFEAARFTGDAVYYVKLEGKVIYPADGIRVVGEVIRKNKMGLYVEYREAIRIQIPRDLHIGNKEYDLVEIGDKIEVELKRSKFQINDPYILASGLFITKRSDTDTVKQPASEEQGSEEEGSEEEGELGEEEDKGAEEEEEESEGEDWDELERKAAAKDAKKNRSRDYSDDERPKKIKR